MAEPPLRAVARGFPEEDMHTVVMTPPPGEGWLRYVGDRVRFTLKRADGDPWPRGARAWLRTNLGRGAALRQEIVDAHGSDRPLPGRSWRDLPMQREGDAWVSELTLTEVGHFKAKAYAADARGWQVWPDGRDFGLSVHPSAYRSANTIYCAFTRLFGATRAAVSTADRHLETRLRRLEAQGYAVLPPSGTLRDLTRTIPHIVDTLGCRILQLLPINPTPTTYARMGRFGSPYASLDLTGIDPALVDFDRRTTAVDQFRELAYAVHQHGARLFLDLVINHTGWSSTLHEQHPEWFVRHADGTFHSPGAWGVTWEDLIDLDENHRDLWDEIAAAFLVWCRRGVDGFRCDAGYKVPMPVWQYIIARVRQEFPETLFFLEGLGGAWHDTESLLTEGGMQWAYSELFQEYSGTQVAGYLDHALRQSRRVGVLVHYSETHDNDRLAHRGRTWSLLRNRLSALASVSGAYGFTCGVEWLATEKIKVHGCTGLAWGNPDNLVVELRVLNRLLAEHPCFLDGAQLTRLSNPDSPVYALRRDAAVGQSRVLVLVNTDPDHPQGIALDPALLADPPQAGRAIRPLAWADLLGGTLERPHVGDKEVRWTLAPGACHCLSLVPAAKTDNGQAYRQDRAVVAWALEALRRLLEPEEIGTYDPRALASVVARDPGGFLGSLADLDRALAARDLVAAIEAALRRSRYLPVVVWEKADVRRITPIPADHWLLVTDAGPFRAMLRGPGGWSGRVESTRVDQGFIAAFEPRAAAGDATLELERYAEGERTIAATVRYLPLAPAEAVPSTSRPARPLPKGLVLLTNGAGAMARLAVDLGQITSKYDCLLGANLHPRVPVDRHILAKRLRVWANANGFLSPLNADNLTAFTAGPPACWQFRAHAGDGRHVDVRLVVAMVPGQNTTLVRLTRPESEEASTALPLRLTVRVDIEDRNFHTETKRNGGAEHHFSTHTRVLAELPGFQFVPAPDRQLRVYTDAGAYHPSPEWCENIPHPVEASRGQVAAGDAYSPGWFELPVEAGGAVTLMVTAEPAAGRSAASASPAEGPGGFAGPGLSPAVGAWATRLRQALQAFLVRRDAGKTVIAGYPWFLDWGRDTLICARGILAAGGRAEVEPLLLNFGRFEDRGTLPNTIHGNDTSNRETSDAPLWYGLVCDDVAAANAGGQGVTLTQAPYALRVDERGRTVGEVLRSIATHYASGTPGGVRMDPESALIWSPAHFTWMDTNYPAATPREGYPIEIQALWIRLLRQLERLHLPPAGEPWGQLAARAERSTQQRFWLESKGYYADVLAATPGQPASAADVDDALRSNCVFAVSLGVASGERARRCLDAVRRHLLIPGGLRSLAPLPLRRPLVIRSADGRLLADSQVPYSGRYEGDEDTRRKPSYHNGTAWTWTLPAFCEGLVKAWDHAPEAVAAARAYLLSLEPLLDEGCLGQLPEILDGDAPHLARGCDAQAWSVTEAFRVWSWLASLSAGKEP